MGSLLYELALADVNTENDPDWYYVYSGTPSTAWSDLTGFRGAVGRRSGG